MSLSLEPDVYEEPIEWTEISGFVEYVTKIKIVVPYETVQQNYNIRFYYQLMPIKLLILLVNKSKHGNVVCDGDYYTITFSSKLFGVDSFDCFQCVIDGEYGCFVKFSNHHCNNNSVIGTVTCFGGYECNSYNLGMCIYLGAFIFIAKNGDLSYKSIKCTVNGIEKELQPISYNSDDYRLYYASLSYSLDDCSNFYDIVEKKYDNYFGIKTNEIMAKSILFYI